jgi:hypothetical protein
MTRREHCVDRPTLVALTTQVAPPTTQVVKVAEKRCKALNGLLSEGLVMQPWFEPADCSGHEEFEKSTIFSPFRPIFQSFGRASA